MCAWGQHEEALAVDSVSAISVGLSALRRSSSPALLKYARYSGHGVGVTYRNRSSMSISRTGADCSADQITPWPLGRQLLHSIRKVGCVDG